MDTENVILKNMSYLHARDPSILAWNRHELKEVRVNLAERINEDSGKSIQNEDQQDSIQVFLRIKDGVQFEDLYEISGNNLVCKVPEGSRSLRNLKEGESMTKTYSFTNIFGSGTTQTDIFDKAMKARILGFINGKNSTVMTYGASGSGKTFTIVGTPEEPGLIPRTLDYIFRTIPNLSKTLRAMPLPNGEVKVMDERWLITEKLQKSMILHATHVDRSAHIKTYKEMQQRLSSESVAKIDDFSNVSVSIWISFAEIYNENIYDLLQSPPIRGKQRSKLRLGNSKNCCYIKDLTSINVSSDTEAYQILQYGLHNLNYASTSVNPHSSRSHSIFTIKLVQISREEDGVYAYISTFNFCDLAGSERLNKTRNIGDRLKESNNINTSLLVLGRCLNNIRSNQQLTHNQPIPFRDSKLTQLFQRALTGLEEMMMIVNMNPSKGMFEETQHVLNFSAIAREILVEEQPKIIRPKKKNRFSQYMERKAASVSSVPEIKEEDERDIEITKLRSTVTDLYLELEQNKLDHQEELKLETEDIRSIYREFIKDLNDRHEAEKTRIVNKITKKYEEKIQELHKHYSELLHNESDIISIDSSSDEDNFDPEQQSYKEQSLKIKSLEQKLQEVKVENESLIKEISRLKERIEPIKVLKERVIELEMTLSEAEKAYSELQLEVQELDMKNKKLTSEKLLLEERVEQFEELWTHRDEEFDEVEDALQLEPQQLDTKNKKLTSEKLLLEEESEQFKELLTHTDDESDHVEDARMLSGQQAVVNNV